MSDFCEREECKHSSNNHPNDGHCIKCRCIGFYRNLKVDDPLTKKYLQLIVDVHTKFNGILDMSSHLNEDFPKMANNFLDDKKLEESEFWKKLVKEDYNLAKETNTVINNFNKFGRIALEGISPKIHAVICNLSHNGANYELSIRFIHFMILSQILIMCRVFIKDTVKIIFELESSTKEEWKKLSGEEKEEKGKKFSDSKIQEMAIEIRKKFGLDLKKDSDFNRFVECFERRNIHTHNEGRPHKKYRDITNYSGPDVVLPIDKEYLESTINLLRKYARDFMEFCLEKYVGVVNISRKGNVHHIDLTKGKGKIIPVKDGKN